jgi:hypothetical protein
MKFPATKLAAPVRLILLTLTPVPLGAVSMGPNLSLSVGAQSAEDPCKGEWEIWTVAFANGIGNVQVVAMISAVRTESIRTT